MNKDLIKRLAIVSLITALGACANVGQSVRDAVSGVAAGGQSPEQRVHASMDLLERGEEARARAMLEAALREEPGNATAKRLLDEITTDPRTLLGARTQAYTVRAGDTMTVLAERFVGDPLMFYALARYNHISPNDLSPGQIIRVPVRARAVSAPVRTAATPSASALPEPPRGSVAVVSAQAAARANQLRLQGLERLNAGDANGAVNLLQQARALDWNNDAIQGDLARALRIQSSLSAH